MKIKRIDQKSLHFISFIVSILFFLQPIKMVYAERKLTKALSPHNQMQEFWLQAYKYFPNALKKKRKLTPVLLAKAEPDECFYGIGISGTPSVPTCGNGGIPKVNQGFVWGMVKSEDNLWFGTGANVQCLAKGAYADLTTPYQTSCYVCEFGESALSPPLPKTHGDWRPPRIYIYNISQKILIEKTPAVPLINATIGIRSAGALNELVFLGGPSLTGGINLFAFKAITGEFLGSKNFPEFNNIRKWLAVQSVLYTTVGNSRKFGQGGSVLRWTGTLEDPFQFEVVGTLDGAGAEIALHENRLFVCTWPSLPESNKELPKLAGLWMSPKLFKNGLTEAHKGHWKKIWQADDYEPDPITALTYGGGALASFDGYLYWGTMHVPFMSTLIHFHTYGLPQKPVKKLNALWGTYRAVSIFRGKNLGSKNKRIQLVYGMPRLPTFIPGRGWEIQSNNMKNPYPLWGPSGFGNLFNLYTWSMSVYQNRLYIGTLDWGLLFQGTLNSFLKKLNISSLSSPAFYCSNYSYGADLFYFPSSKSPALPESIDGIGNYTNYGLRTMVSDDYALYIGTANPMNLLTDLNDDLPEGGWELIRLTPLRDFKYLY